MIGHNAMIGGKQLRLDELRGLEATIRRGLTPFFEVGHALYIIEKQEYFRDADYASFDDYCREVWQWTPRRAHQMIEAAEIISILDVENKMGLRDETASPVISETSSPDVNNCSPQNPSFFPKNEGQTRPLVKVKHQPEVAREIWGEAAEEHGNDLIARHVEQHVERRLPPKTAAPPSNSYFAPPSGEDRLKRDAKDCLYAINLLPAVLERIDPATRVSLLDDAGLQRLNVLVGQVQMWLAAVLEQLRISSYANREEPF
jgi:hypothetical protein